MSSVVTLPNISNGFTPGRRPGEDRHGIEAFHNSRRIAVNVEMNGQPQTATFLVSEVRQGDLAQSPLFAVWVVSEEIGNDSPKEELTTQEAALVERLRTAVEKSCQFVILQGEDLSALSMSHPEGISGRHVFFIEPIQISGDGFEMLCQLTTDLQNTQNPQQSARQPSVAHSSTRRPEVPPIQRVLSVLIERHSDDDTIGALVELLPGLLDCTQSCTPEILAQELAAALGQSGLGELVDEANNLVHELYPHAREMAPTSA